MLSRAWTQVRRKASGVDVMQEGLGHLVREPIEAALQELLVGVDLLSVEDDLVDRVVPVGPALDDEVGEELVLQGREKVEVCVELISRERSDGGAGEGRPVLEAQDKCSSSSLAATFPLYQELHDATLPSTKPGGGS